jgi:P-type Cu+ transporter
MNDQKADMGGNEHGRGGHAHHPMHNPGGSIAQDRLLATDPVCEMRVNPATSQHRANHGSQTFHFCSAGCRTTFEAPQTAAAAATVRRKGVIYTCPMHPQIQQEGPGRCPICGMALEALEGAARAGPAPELIDMEAMNGRQVGR